MAWSFTIARIAGIDVRVHVTFLMLLAWFAVVHYRTGGVEAVFAGVGFILALFACVLLHEFGHAFAARVFGIPTPDITLLPIGGVARLQRMPDEPMQEIVVALAGPAVNVVIAAVLFTMVGHPVEPGEILALGSPDAGLLPMLAVVNVWLVLFNLLPAFPMDGGRVLRAVIALFRPYAAATQIAARVGQGMAFLFGLIGLFGNPLLLFIALFVYLAAAQEASFAQMKDIARGLHVGDAMVTGLRILPPSASLHEAADAMLRMGQHEFPVVGSRGELLGVLTRDRVIGALRTHAGADVPVAEVVEANVPVVSERVPLAEALLVMEERGVPALVVKDRFGRIVGLATPESVGELMMMRSVLPPRTERSWRVGGGRLERV